MAAVTQVQILVTALFFLFVFLLFIFLSSFGKAMKYLFQDELFEIKTKMTPLKNALLSTIFIFQL